MPYIDSVLFVMLGLNGVVPIPESRHSLCNSVEEYPFFWH